MAIRTTDNSEKTFHAAAGRLPQARALVQYQHFAEDSLLRRFLDAIPTQLVVLNMQRQIIFSNRAVLEFLGASSAGSVVGSRPGEVFGCINADTLPGGCGTAEKCRTCGAVNAILAAIDGRSEQQEYRLTRAFDNHTESLDLRVHTMPLDHQGERFIVFTVQDISDQKRRSVLEKIFFHDILNLAGGVKSFAQLLADNPDGADAPEMVRLIESAASQVVEEINAQRMLLAAENKELKVHPELLNGQEILSQAAALYQRHPIADQQTIQVEACTGDFWFTSDAALVGRVLGNMLKNALEAGRKGDKVTIGFIQQGQQVQFRVHNRAFIKKEVQQQLFQRSFSTKGHGRGIGTYGMRLLAEEFLGGRVVFESTPEDGTTFQLILPQNFPSD
ncbi:MAG TPA: GHKL domain-containing protein [Geoalkalibacter subterraneus]|uniref:histidine kinase n=1 Tax=Geoalkalibacter subterraneus TaxID=483547 RepID=A0A831PII6_9BACT|nr:GHKL domain-containing protein [Geoalkalibacter subterraneus]